MDFTPSIQEIASKSIAAGSANETSLDAHKQINTHSDILELGGSKGPMSVDKRSGLTGAGTLPTQGEKFTFYMSIQGYAKTAFFVTLFTSMAIAALLPGRPARIASGLIFVPFTVYVLATVMAHSVGTLQ